MTFSLVKPGGWAFGELLTSAQMNALDTDHANAVDGNQGGSYSLAAPLSIGGDEVTISDLVAPNVSGVTTFANDIHLQDDIFVDGDAALSGDLGVDGNTQLGAVTTVGATSSDALVVNATASFETIATFNDDVFLYSHLGGSPILSAKLLTVGAGRVVKRISPGVDANASFGPRNWDIVRVGMSLSTDRDYTIDDTGAVDGDEIEFSIWSGPNGIFVKDPGGGVITTIVSGGTYDWVRCVRMSGSWVALSRGKHL